MCIQSEKILEEKFIEQLTNHNYQYVKIANETELKTNFKKQFELHNKTLLDNKEIPDKKFDLIFNNLNSKNTADFSKFIRDKFIYRDEKNKPLRLEFIDTKNWSNNIFQVTNQYNANKRAQRYDVTILINGLPLVQIELKRRGIEIKEAFNQIIRYKNTSFTGLFYGIQLFIISNGVNTKYFANNKVIGFKDTFFWTDVHNKKISDIEPFTEAFLSPHHLFAMIFRFTIINSDNNLMTLRPYQYYAVKKIIDRVKSKSHKNGYIWHSTGSGKTLTSFIASRILQSYSEVDKVIFLVDRKDLDYQTMKEFNNFSKGSVDSTDNTRTLINQLNSPSTKLIISTIQKLYRALISVINRQNLAEVANKKIVFIFDECHRSQFNTYHATIDSFFKNKIFFGFTGTPIFTVNNVNGKTTKTIFSECLHKYTILNAINDHNILPFSIEYYKTVEYQNDDIDFIKKSDDNEKQLYNNTNRLDKIVDFIIKNHKKKTHQRQFNALFATGSIDELFEIYQIFKAKQHNLKIGAIFSINSNPNADNNNKYLETDKDESANTQNIGTLPKVAEPTKAFKTQTKQQNKNQNNVINTKNSARLNTILEDYNKMFGTNFTSQNILFDTDTYNKSISKNIKNRKLDIVIVVDMLLTGFDAKGLNTLYVDKNLCYHGLIQAFSRTNRTDTELKSYGNIVCFRNLKQRTDTAITLYSNENAKEDILVKPYKDFQDEFNKILVELYKLTPTAQAVDELISESSKSQFVKIFRNLLRIHNKLTTYSEHKQENIKISPQEFANYKGKYLDIYQETRKKNTTTESDLGDIDFEIELINRDIVNVDYIISLLIKLAEIESNNSLDTAEKEFEYTKLYNFVLNEMDNNTHTRDKKDEIIDFINDELPNIKDSNLIKDNFDNFLDSKRKSEIDNLCKEYSVECKKLKQIFEKYEYTSKIDRTEVSNIFTKPYGLLERTTYTDKIINHIKKITEKYSW